MTGYYDRQGHPLSDVMELAQLGWNNEGQWLVRQSRHRGRRGEVWISTVFLGIDHNFGRQGPPLIFETMAWRLRPRGAQVVVDRLIDGEELIQWRYWREQEAVEGHRRAIALLG